ncbi:MAG: hypothetical protein KF745_13610 [Phycisphaeraceae bacterium]|nr:hypothetical protein [Phycisphaeraceae bacterium]
MFTPQQFEVLFPLACAWAERQEEVALCHGVPLSPSQSADAARIGIARPERIRLLNVDRIPQPDDPSLLAAADALQFLTPATTGLCLRYGIFVHRDAWGDRRLVVHELVHTLQYERLGGFREFLRQYLLECMTVGYSASAMEQEAVSVTSRICS